MKSITVDIPPSLRILNPNEIRSIVIRMGNDNFREEMMSTIVSGRYRTKRSANAIAKRIVSSELKQLMIDIEKVKKVFDFTSTYTLYVDDHLMFVSLRQ